MSFSAAIYAANKAAAVAQIADAAFPQSVKDFATAAVNAIASDVVVSVVVSGHLHDPNTDSTEVSNASIVITPMHSV